MSPENGQYSWPDAQWLVEFSRRTGMRSIFLQETISEQEALELGHWEWQTHQLPGWEQLYLENLGIGIVKPRLKAFLDIFEVAQETQIVAVEIRAIERGIFPDSSRALEIVQNLRTFYNYKNRNINLRKGIL